MDDLRTALAVIFKRKGKDRLTMNEIVMSASMDHHWFDPENAKKQLEQLKKLDQGPAEKLGQALKEGDFKKALDELNKLAEKLGGEAGLDAGRKRMGGMGRGFASLGNQLINGGSFF